jgi:hypothetical protein
MSELPPAEENPMVVVADPPTRWLDFLGTLVVFLSFVTTVAAYVLLRIFESSEAAGPIDELLLIMGGAVAAIATAGAASTRR